MAKIHPKLIKKSYEVINDLLRTRTLPQAGDSVTALALLCHAIGITLSSL